MDGPTAAKELRALGYTRPIIGCTGNGLESDIRHFKQMGASHVLVKPINLSAFEDIMKTFYEKSLHEMSLMSSGL